MTYAIPLLSWLVWLPFVVGLLLLAFPQTAAAEARTFALIATAVQLLLAIVVWQQFDCQNPHMQLVEKITWSQVHFLPLTYALGVDGLGMTLILLAAAVLPGVVLLGFQKKPQVSLAVILSLVFCLQGCLLGAICSLDALLFYAFWEGMLIPIVLLWSLHSIERQFGPIIRFLSYTLAGSLALLVGIIMVVVMMQAHGYALSLYLPHLQVFTQKLAPNLTTQLLFFFFSIAFWVKLPLCPLHGWLTSTYLHAPLGLMVMLSAVMVKVGLLAWWRWGLGLFPQLAAGYLPGLAVVAAFGMLYGALLAYNQQQARAVVAYSSLSHINMMLLALTAANRTAVAGSSLLWLAHGLGSSLLLLLLLHLENQGSSLYLQKTIKLSHLPRFASLLVLVVLSTMGVPGLAQFPGELLVILGVFSQFTLGPPYWFAVLAMLVAVGVMFTTAYALRFLHQLLYDGVSGQESNITDLTAAEMVVALPLAIALLWLGCCPQPINDLTAATWQSSLQQLQTQPAAVLPNLPLSNRSVAH